MRVPNPNSILIEPYINYSSGLRATTKFYKRCSFLFIKSTFLIPKPQALHPHKLKAQGH